MKILGKLSKIKHSLIVPVLILIMGGIFSNLLAWQQSITNQTELQKLFEADAKKLVDSVTAYIETYQNGLLGTRGIITVYGDQAMTRNVFKSYVESRNLEIEYPGTRGFGFIRRVSRHQEAEFLKQIHQNDMPAFTIKEFAPPPR